MAGRAPIPAAFVRPVQWPGPIHVGPAEPGSSPGGPGWPPLGEGLDDKAEGCVMAAGLDQVLAYVERDRVLGLVETDALAVHECAELAARVAYHQAGPARLDHEVVPRSTTAASTGATAMALKSWRPPNSRLAVPTTSPWRAAEFPDRRTRGCARANCSAQARKQG